MKSPISQSVLQQISEQNIKPRSKWYFYAKNAAFWGGYFFSIIIGALAFGAMLLGGALFLIPSIPDLYTDRVAFTVLPLVLLWGCVTLGSILLATWGFHHTKAGYKCSSKKLILVNLICAILLGGILFATRGTAMIDRALTQNIAFFPGLESQFHKSALRPEAGRLTGVLVGFDQDQKEAILLDPKKIEWILQFKSQKMFDVADALHQSHVIIQGEKTTGIISQTEPNTFEVNKIESIESLHQRFIEKGQEFLDRNPDKKRSIEKRIEDRKNRRPKPNRRVPK